MTYNVFGGMLNPTLLLHSYKIIQIRTVLSRHSAVEQLNVWYSEVFIRWLLLLVSGGGVAPSGERLRGKGRYSVFAV